MIEIRAQLAAFITLAVVFLLPIDVYAAGLAGPWADGYKSRVRLVVGQELADSGPRNVAGVEIEMGKDWKTYWRNPGDAGGLPPEFNWSRSVNLKSARVLYPTPQRLADETGESIGYKGGVVFPVVVEAQDASKPVKLVLDIFYGVCLDICIPAQAVIELDVPAQASIPGMPVKLARALSAIPASTLPEAGAQLVEKNIAWDGDKPRATFKVDFGPDGKGGDLFVEGPKGVYIPMSRKVDAGSDGKVTFEVNLADVSRKELAGQSLTLTLAGAEGQGREVRVPVK